MAKDLHQLLRERDLRRSEEVAAAAASAAAAVVAGGGGVPPVDGGDGDGARGGGGDNDDACPDRRASRDEALLASLSRPVVLAALFFTFAVGLFVGSRRDSAQADEGTRSGAPDASATELRRIDAAAASMTAGSPLLLGADLSNTQNRFTIQLASYSDSAAAAAVAEEHVMHLEQLGYRVVGPLRVGRSGHLVVLVEAAPSKADLADLCARLQTLPSPRGDKPRFPDAYVRAIDDLIER